jgi:site-specific DNA-methyltransferase (adenine-specific)
MDKIIQGDCVEVMKTFPDNYVTTIITDPPYGLAFMGKKWDDFGTDLKKFQEWVRIWAVEAFRVAKPGATLLCFGGTRTFHRLTCGLEDAGWQIKDVLMWLYGCGFPKSLDISKAIDKLKGAEREIICKHPNPAGSKGNTFPLNQECYITAPATQEAKEWEGYGTALKPAYEPIVMAIKPNDGSYANNALKWGVAGLNIDGGRIPTAQKWTKQDYKGHTNPSSYLIDKDYYKKSHPQGRFPANVILDEESAELVDKQSGITKSRRGPRGIRVKGYSAGIECKRDPEGIISVGGYNDGGGASRFFYCAKASRSERTVNKQVENDHPTLKPLELIKYLVKLATPPNGLVLDPFVGSGTTCVACKILGYDCIGIERELNYVEIANKRLEAIKVNDVLF